MQKWSKGKQKEKVNNAVLFDQGTYDKMLTEVPKFKQITPSVLSERLRVNMQCYHFIESMFLLLLLPFLDLVDGEKKKEFSRFVE